MGTTIVIRDSHAPDTIEVVQKANHHPGGQTTFGGPAQQAAKPVSSSAWAPVACSSGHVVGTELPPCMCQLPRQSAEQSAQLVPSVGFTTPLPGPSVILRLSHR